MLKRRPQLVVAIVALAPRRRARLSNPQAARVEAGPRARFMKVERYPGRG